MAPSSPQLPAEFLEKLRADSLVGSWSTSFTKAFHEERLQMTHNTTFLLDHPDHPIQLGNMPAEIGGSDLKRSSLHIAALSGDVVLASEIIRLGATIDLKDTTGKTPLFLAIETASACRISLSADLAGNPSRPKAAKKMRSEQIGMLRRLRFITQTLLEQHADPNCSYNGLQPLYYACSSMDWDVITLLLQHGANPTISRGPMNLMKSNADKSRYHALVSSLALSPRPPRMCPCWSGKTLTECHDAESKPFPPDFLCRCGTGRIFRKCCGTRKIKISERWNDEEQWILTSYLSPISPVMDESELGRIEKNTNIMMDLADVLPPPTQDSISSFMKDFAESLHSKGLIDPAFAYAMKETELPRAVGRKVSKGNCLEVQVTWNKAIDKYISLGKDTRAKDVIERAAKIGESNGVLYRMCEGVGCTNTEGCGEVKVRLCSRCKISVYCSSACQLSAWTAHKMICGSNGQVEQTLPSQDAVEEHVKGIWHNMADMDLTPPPGVVPFLEALRSSEQHT